MTISLSNKEKRDALLYNLLPGDRDLIAAFQGGKDPITLQALKPNANCDHDHQTGLIRGLLNPMTNKRLQDDTVKLVRTLNYLENPPAVAALGEQVFGLLGRASARKKRLRYGPHGADKPQARAVELRPLPEANLSPRRPRKSGTRRTSPALGRPGVQGSVPSVL